MLAFLLAGSWTGPRVETATIPAPKGHGRLTVTVPPGYRVAGRNGSRILLVSGQSQFIVTWTARAVTPTLRKAMAASEASLRKHGNVLGPVAIGPYKGSLLRMPIGHGRSRPGVPPPERPAGQLDSGLGLHAPLIWGQDRISITYFDPTIKPAATPEAIRTVRRFISEARLSGA